jgi:hypothetical protein
MILKLLGGQAIFSQGPSDLKINQGHLLIMTNLNTKYEDCVPKDYYVIGQAKKTRRTARQVGGRTDKLILVYPLITLLCGGIKNSPGRNLVNIKINRNVKLCM